MLKSLIFVLLLDNYVQVIKSWKVLSLFFELEGFTLTLAIDLLEDFILVLLLEAIGKERKNGKTWLSYEWYQKQLGLEQSVVKKSYIALQGLCI